jgi:large repetitive protein
MATATDLGPLLDVAKAVGLVKADGSLNPDWFGDPGGHTGQMLRAQPQRDALLHGLDTLLGEDADLFVDEKNRSWVPIVDHGGVGLYLVVEVADGATVLGLGARLRTSQPVSQTDVLVPLVRIPAGKVEVIPDTAKGRIHLRTEVGLNGAPPTPGKAALDGLAFDVDVAADGTTPKLSVLLRGLQLPGELAPHDLLVDGTGSPAALSDQAVKLVVGVVQRSVGSATGPLAELLALVGLTKDAAVPALPVAGILQRGVVAWREWLAEVLQGPGAKEAWLGHLAALIASASPAGAQSLTGAAPAVVPPSGPGEPYRIAWTVANGIAVAATVRPGTTAAGAPEVELGAEARVEKAGMLPAGLELTAVLVRMTLGPAPAVRTLPRLSLLGRMGPAGGGAPLLDVTTPQVGSTPGHQVRSRSLRVGFALDAGRKPVFVIAAHDVKIAEHSYPVLDLTNTQTLADVGQAALGDITADLLGRLGAAELPVRVLLGLNAPPGEAAWPVALTRLTDLLANPVRAVAGYHDRVLKTHRAGYAKLLKPLGALLIAPDAGQALAPQGPAAVAGDEADTGGAALGEEDNPWRVPLAEGVALTAWADSGLHLAVAVDRSVADLGGGCPTVALAISVELARIRLDAVAGQVLTRLSAQLRFGARDGVPLRIGERDAAIVAETIGVGLRWVAGGPLRAALEAPGLVADIGGRQTLVELPSVASDGSFTAEIPWEALELLSGHLLRRTGAPWAAAAVDLLGWLPSDEGGPATPARLPLENLATDPVRALRGFALATAGPRLAGWLALLVSGPAGPGIAAGVAPGRGDVASPHALPLSAAGADAARSLRLLLFDRARHELPIDPFRPGVLLGWLSAPAGTGSAPTPEELAGALRQAAAHGRIAADVVDGRTAIAAGFAALLARWADSDGLVTAAKATLPGATVHDLNGVAHPDLPAALTLPALGIPSSPAVVYATTALEPATWPGVSTDHVIDLAAPGLAPEAFDVARLATEDGPWAVRLPRRAEAVSAPGQDGFAQQVGRLARAVDAVVARAAGKTPVVLVGYGAAGHAAARVAATRPGIAHLVTIGTAHGGVALDILDAPAAGDALQLLRALLPEPDSDPLLAEHPSVVLGRALLAALAAPYAVQAPAVDLGQPSAGPAIPPSVAVHCIRGRFSAQAASKALTGLIVRGLQEAYESEPGPVQDITSSGLGTGIALRLNPVAATGAVRVRGNLALTLPGPGTDHGAGRALRFRFEVDRVGGWLAGGPDPARPPGAPRGPALRRATLELDVSFGPVSEAPHARIVLHEGEAYGVRRRRWELTGEGEPMTAEARTLVGLLAGALGPLPAAGPVRDLVDVLAALGITEPGTSEATGAPVSFSVEGIRRVLLDPAALLAERPPQPLAAALARLTGAPPPVAGAPTRFSFNVDGLTVTADVAARTVQVQTATSGLALAAGAQLNGALDVTAGGTVSGSGRLALGAGLSIEAALPKASVRLVLADGGGSAGLPATVALYPQPDQAGLRRILAAVAPAEVLWAGVTFVRSLGQPGVDAVVDPLLRAVGLLRPDGRLVVPAVLLADPGRWLMRLAGGKTGVAAAPGGPGTDGFAAALDALGALLGLPSAGPGALRFPYGIELSAASSGSRARLTIAVPTPPATTGLRMSGSASLVAGGGLPVVPQAALALATPAANGKLTVLVGSTGTTARLAVPDIGLDVALVPPGAGLAGSAAAAVLHALPHVLDAIAGLPSGSPGFPVGQALGTLGDRLALRVGGAFSADQLEQLAAAPGPQLAARLSANLGPALAALRDLLAPAVPSFLALTATSTDVTLARTGQTSFELKLSVPSPAGVRVAGLLKGRKPFTGATLDADMAVDANGLSVAHLLLDVKPANALDLGPLSIAPRIDVAAGPAAAGGPHLAVGLVVPDAVISGVLRPGPPRTFAVEATGAPLADAITLLLLPLAVDLALSTSQMQTLLAKPVLGGTVKSTLENVVFKGGELDPGALRPAEAFTRLLKLGSNVAKAPKAPKLQIPPLTIAASSRTDTGGNEFLGLSVTLPPGQRFDLVDGDVTVQAEVDGTWVRPEGLAQGVTVEVLQLPKAGGPTPFILVALRGIGLRVARKGAPLIDGFVVTDSVAAHGLIEVGSTGVAAAGGQLELSGLRMPVGSATGGDNKLARGIMRDSASGSEPLAPKFSPGLAIQRRSNQLRIDLRAGAGDGPWFIPIQRGFGPVYIEQVGFGVARATDRVTAARVLVDGRVALLGLTVAVDDLALGANWPQTSDAPEITDPRSWEIGLAGLAVGAQTGGLSISGGLRRVSMTVPDYVGMISLRFGPYGLTAYGGYGVLSDELGNFTSLFIFGALNAPIGGPPAFFVTGIGAGVGVNRQLKLPPQLADLPAYPLVQALDPNSSVAVSPEQALEQLRVFFPAERGAFWFAAGVSFTSFALVDCVAVLGVAVSDGLELTLMGLARAALPTTAAPLAQLELALLVRFSSREGVLWVQGQLTDNSWLLTKDVRLTGGFAYVSWFKGDKAGEFVLTVGGYHPSFHRDGYPVVPRVGFRWGISKVLVIKGESYFALTSEAIMAGTRFEASLTLGPLWAYLRLGADGIIWFDPFRFEVTAFAELGAGITVDIDLGWFGHIRFTIAFHLHADVLLAGPNFHGTATIDLGVTSATIAFGDDSGPPALPLPWDAFLGKYLQAGGAQVLTAVPGRGQAPATTTGSKKPPTGAPGDAFLMQPEFDLTVTTTAATTAIAIGGAGTLPVAGADPLAAGPMQVAVVNSTLGVSIKQAGSEHAHKFKRQVTLGQFPKGVWGPQADDKPLPKGETLTAGTGVQLTAEVKFGPQVSPMEYHQVEIGPRKPNPLLAALQAHVTPAGFVPEAAGDPGEAFAIAADRLREGPLGGPLTPTAAATFRSGRSAPPQLARLTLGVGTPPPDHVEAPVTRGNGAPPAFAAARNGTGPPSVRAVLGFAPSPAGRPRPRTTVGRAGDGLTRVSPPGAGALGAALDRHDGRLALQLEFRPPATTPGWGGPGYELRRAKALSELAASRLAELDGAATNGGIELAAGEVIVLTVPGAERDDDADRRPAIVVEGGQTRVVALDTVGGVVRDVGLSEGAVTLPLRIARVALIGGGAPADAAAGWSSGSLLLQIGGRALVGPGCTIESSAVSTRRRQIPVSTAFVRAEAAVGGFSVVTTRLPASTRSLAIQLVSDDAARDASLELGITGAHAVGEPIEIVDGEATTTVHALEPDADAEQVVVTVASGQDLNLAGVLGSVLDARELAELLTERQIDGLLGTLVPTPEAGARVRWAEPDDAAPDEPPTRKP